MAERHAVADLLTDAMRARVSAARFYRDDDPDREFCAAVVATVNGTLCCPMGVALGPRGTDRDFFPISDQVCEVISDMADVDAFEAIKIIQSFIDLVDEDGIEDPASVYAMLGCEPPEAPNVD